MAQVPIVVTDSIDAAHDIHTGVVLAISIFQKQQVLNIQCTFVGVIWLSSVIPINADRHARANSRSYIAGNGNSICCDIGTKNYGVGLYANPAHSLAYFEIRNIGKSQSSRIDTGAVGSGIRICLSQRSKILVQQNARSTYGEFFADAFIKKVVIVTVVFTPHAESWHIWSR